jgi:glucosamine 6-phosphate synthetase-like amidotransferase/phosphosugar isomerase protein
MCSLFGSSDVSMYEILFEVNKVRGAFASSICTLIKDDYDQVCDHWVGKFQNVVDISKIEFIVNQQAYIMGHFQAPTSAKRKWDYDTSHPFETMDWLIAHNGVLTNFDYLNMTYTPWNVNPVDSSVIVSMLQQEYEDGKKISIKKEHELLEKVLDRIEGTFALYIVNTNNWNTYICRQGSTLFYDVNGNFSSIAGRSMVEVPEGKIYQLVNNYKSFKQIGEFQSKSPFLVL